MEEISRKKEVDEVIEVKKSLRAMLKTYNPVTNVFDNVANDYPDPWIGLDTNPIAWYQQDEIDIAGLTTIEEKALAISAVDIYGPEMYQAGTQLGSADAGFPPLSRGWTWTIITDVPFDVNAWYFGTNIALLGMRLPGIFSDMNVAKIENISTDNILFGRFRNFQNNVDTITSSALVQGESFFGDAKMTMSDRLYVTRFVKYEGAVSAVDRISVPEIQLVIQGHKVDLTDLEQIMELRRSYLLQETIV